MALIELTALCDILGLDLKRSKAGKWKAPGQPLRRNLGDAGALPPTHAQFLQEVCRL